MSRFVPRNLTRNLTPKIHFLFDQCLPPLIRDSKFMALPLRLFFKDQADLFLRFKEQAHTLSEAQLARVYRTVRAVVPQRQTDLNDGCVEATLRSLMGRTVLEVGCGRGFLAGKMSVRHRVTGVDIVIDPSLPTTYPDVHFAVGTVERLPFPDGGFDTVVCAHTLEHVRDIMSAVRELRRVAKKRLILVVPKQRPYRFTFDLHLHFFPYEWSLLAMLHTRGRVSSCQEIGGDLFYVEDPVEDRLMGTAGRRVGSGASLTAISSLDSGHEFITEDEQDVP